MIDSILSPDQVVFLFVALVGLTFAAFPIASFSPNNKWSFWVQFLSPLPFGAAALILCLASSVQTSFCYLGLWAVWPFAACFLLILFITTMEDFEGEAFLFSRDSRLSRLIVFGVLSALGLVVFGGVFGLSSRIPVPLQEIEKLSLSAHLLSPERQNIFNDALAGAVCDGELSKWEMELRPYPLSLVDLSERLQKEERKAQRREMLEKLIGDLKCANREL